MQAQAFASWKDLLVYQQAKRAAMSDSVKRFLQGPLEKSCIAWKSKVQELAESCAFVMQAQAFASWKDLLVYRQAKRTALSNSVKRLLQGTLGRAFTAWNSRVHEQAGLKARATACLARFMHSHIAQAFSAWVDWIAMQKDHR